MKVVHKRIAPATVALGAIEVGHLCIPEDLRFNKPLLMRVQCNFLTGEGFTMPVDHPAVRVRYWVLNLEDGTVSSMSAEEPVWPITDSALHIYSEVPR